MRPLLRNSLILKLMEKRSGRPVVELTVAEGSGSGWARSCGTGVTRRACSSLRLASAVPMCKATLTSVSGPALRSTTRPVIRSVSFGPGDSGSGCR